MLKKSDHSTLLQFKMQGKRVLFHLLPHRLPGLVILIMLSLSAGAQEFLFSNINEKNGLPNSRITSFCRDEMGFMWFGTDHGLCRYDGYSVKTFKHNPRDSQSIPANRISQIFELPDHKLLIRAGSKHIVFDQRQNTFTTDSVLHYYDTDIPLFRRWYALSKHDGKIWFSNSKEIYLIDIPFEKVSVTNFMDSNNPGPGMGEIINMASDPLGNTWFVTNKGKLGMIDPVTMQAVNVQTFSELERSSVDMLIDSDGDFWFRRGSDPLGLLYYQPVNRKKEVYTTTSEDITLSSNLITALAEDEKGRIWVGTNHGGIDIIVKREQKIVNVSNDPLNERSLAQDVITEIYRDHSNIIWVGTYKKGVSYYHSQLHKFDYYRVKSDQSVSNAMNDINSLAEDHQGNIWIGTNGSGLFYWERSNNSFTNYRHDPKDPNSLSNDVIVGMCIDSKNRLWIGTFHGGMDYFDGSKFNHFRNQPGNPKSLADNRVWDIYEDTDNKLWIGTIVNGVNVFDPDKKEFLKHYHRTEDFNTIQSNVIFDIIEDKEGDMWFATAIGIQTLSHRTGLFKLISDDPYTEASLCSSRILELYEDSRGLIWAATPQGVSIINTKTDSIFCINEQDGLGSNSIQGILEDESGNIWLSTVAGISKLHFRNDSNHIDFNITNYEKSDGLQGDFFNERSALRTTKGELIFGGDNGITVIEPSDLHMENIPFQLVFTSLEYQGKKVNVKDTLDGIRPLKAALPFTDEIKLTYKQNSFALEFAALNLISPETRKYKYQLKGFDPEWIEASASQRRVSYTNLNPGKYIFQLRATENDGTWNVESKKLNIYILPPWWKSGWFRLGLVVICVLLVLLIIRIRVYKLKSQKQNLEKSVRDRTRELTGALELLQEKQEEISIQNEELAEHRLHLEKLVSDRTEELVLALKRLEESDRLKSAFLANMSHEIRTPMNAIVGFASMLQAPELEPQERDEFIDIINQNCDSLLVLINDILDISMIEANELRIHSEPIKINHILEELTNLHSLKNEKGLELIYEHNNEYPDLVIENDPIRFRQVMANLLGNALKYTDSGYVKYGYRVDTNYVTFYVEDSGPGINQEYQESIFDHFRKVEDNNERLHRGTGLGLSISKKLVSLMGGNIWVKSTRGQGSTFYFTLPNCQSNATEKIVNSTNGSIPNLTEYHMLITEDEETNYYLLKRLIKKTNASISWAKNGREALEFVRESKQHQKLIILMDIKMPVMDGVMALDEIHKLNNHIPVIAVTAYAKETERFEILKNRFSGYITKPIDAKQLYSLLTDIILKP